MKAIEAEKFLNELVDRLGGTNTFEKFVRFISEASCKGFKVVPYSMIEYENGPRKEYGAMVFGQFENGNGELIEVAFNPILSDFRNNDTSEL